MHLYHTMGNKNSKAIEFTTKEIWRELMARAIGRSVTRETIVMRICALVTTVAALKQKEFEQFLVAHAEELKRAPFLLNSFYGLQKIIHGVFSTGINFGRILSTLAYCYTVFKNWLHTETSIDIWLHLPTKLMTLFEHVTVYVQHCGGWQSFLSYFNTNNTYFYFCSSLCLVESLLQ